MAGWGKRPIPDQQKEESEKKQAEYIEQYEQTGTVKRQSEESGLSVKTEKRTSK